MAFMDFHKARVEIVLEDRDITLLSSGTPVQVENWRIVWNSASPHKCPICARATETPSPEPDMAADAYVSNDMIRSIVDFIEGRILHKLRRNGISVK